MKRGSQRGMRAMVIGALASIAGVHGCSASKEEREQAVVYLITDLLRRLPEG